MSDTDSGSVPPEGYELYDDEREQYRCPFCDGRMLRVGDYAECTECGERFQRSQDADTGCAVGGEQT